MLHVGISYSFEKKKRLLIVDYIRPSPVYQVKCKLVGICLQSNNFVHIWCQTHFSSDDFLSICLQSNYFVHIWSHMHYKVTISSAVAFKVTVLCICGAKCILK